MKKLYALCLIFVGILLADCAAHKKVEYVFPEYIQEERRPELLETFEKGRKLYEMNCAKCHGIFTKGKDGIPNFTSQQIDNYTAWAIKRDPRNHAVAAKMDTQQLQEVFMFLKFRKKKGAPAQVILKNPAPIDSLGNSH